MEASGPGGSARRLGLGIRGMSNRWAQARVGDFENEALYRGSVGHLGGAGP